MLYDPLRTDYKVRVNTICHIYKIASVVNVYSLLNFSLKFQCIRVFFNGFHSSDIYNTNKGLILLVIQFVNPWFNPVC